MPSNSLPREVWDLIFQYLNYRAHLASVCLVCRDFDSIIHSNQQLARKLMKAIRFANEHGSGVDVVDDGSAAVCKTTRTGYPHIFSHTAWVTYEADTATATPHSSLASRNSRSKEQLYLAHFSIDEEPSIYFSISLSMVRTAVARVDCPLHFMISYFGDGDLHAYGSRANYRESNRDEARFKKGDIISVQLGMYDAYKAHQSYKFTPKPQEWRRVVEAKNTRSRIYDESVTNRDRFPSYPYVIFFKNFKMVHDPIVFPDVEQWPVYVGAFLTKQGEKVTLMTPSPPAQRFAPVFPYPPDRRSREEDERELREREARERRELERWEESRLLLLLLLLLPLALLASIAFVRVAARAVHPSRRKS